MVNRSMKLQNVQALRGLAALAVVAAHIGDPDGFESRWLAGGHHWTQPLHGPGQAGVDLFFVISGLIMMVTTTRREPGAANAKQFMLRRLTRIYPAYWVATAPVLLLFIAMPSMVNSSQGDPPRIFESIFLLPQPGLPLLLVGWTLTYELYFYVIFTLTFFAPKNARLPILAGWGAVTALLTLLPNRSHNPWLQLIMTPICLEFLFGAVIGWLIVQRRFYYPEVFTGVGLVAVAVALGLGGDAFPGNWYRAVPVGLLVAVLVYGVIGLEARGYASAPGWMTQIGDASYSIYLWHVLILTALGRFFLIHLPDQPIVHAVALLFSVAAVMIGSLIAYRIIEQPLMHLFHDRVSGKKPSEPIVADAPGQSPLGSEQGVDLREPQLSGLPARGRHIAGS